MAPNVGVIYTGKKKKVAEHGGFAHDDTNVIMLAFQPGFLARKHQHASADRPGRSDDLKALGLDPHSLQSGSVGAHHGSAGPLAPTLGTLKRVSGKPCHKRGGRPGHTGRPPLIFRRSAQGFVPALSSI